MESIFADVCFFGEFAGEEAVAVEDFGEVFGGDGEVAFGAAGVFFPVGPGEVFVVNDIIDGIAFHHEGSAKVAFIRREHVGKLFGVVVAGDHEGGGAVEEPPLLVKAPAGLRDFRGRSGAVAGGFAGFFPNAKAEAGPFVMGEPDQNSFEGLDGNAGFGDEGEVGEGIVFEGGFEKSEGGSDEGDFAPGGFVLVCDLGAFKETADEVFRALGMGEDYHVIGRLIEPFLPDFGMVNVATGQEKESEFWGRVEDLRGEAFGEEVFVNVRMNFLRADFSVKGVGGSGEVGFVDRLPGEVGVAGVGGDFLVESGHELVGGEGVDGRRFVEGVHRGHDVIVGAFVDGPGVGIEGTSDFDEALAVGDGAGGVLAAEVEDAPVVGEVDAADEFAEVGVEDGVILEEKEGGGFLLLGLADGEADGEGEGVAAFVFVPARVATKAGVDGGETLRGEADLIEVEFQFGAAILTASEVDVGAEGEGLFEVHGGLQFSFP